MRGKLIDLCSALRFDGTAISIPELLVAGDILSRYYPSPAANDKESIRLILMSCLIKDEAAVPVFKVQFERWWARWFGADEQDVPLTSHITSLQEAILQGNHDNVERLFESAAHHMRILVTNGNGSGDMIGEGQGEGRGEGGEGGPLERWSTNRIVYERLRRLLEMEQFHQDLKNDQEKGIWQRAHALRSLNRAEAALRKASFSDPLSPRRHVYRPRNEDVTDIDISRASFTQIQKMKLLVPSIVRKLSHRKKYKQDGRRGILQFRKTMRSSLSHGGIPVELLFKRKTPKRERIALLCDLSGSVEQFSSFALQLAHSFSSQFAGVRCFGFISDIDEITRYVSSYDFPKSMKGLYANCSFVSGTDNSNYGHVFQQFVHKYLTDIGRSTSVLILGDARTNGKDPGLEAFLTLRSGVKEVHWLNPESKESWNYGDSVMTKYIDLCDSVHHIRTVNDLASFIADLQTK
jgi:uncharacterized protein with von Willebrand factor type A (vWA) domain